MFDKYQHKSISNIPELVIDICAGDHSLAKYYLRKYPNCRVLSFDIKSEYEALRTVPEHLQDRIRFVSTDVTHLTELDIARHIRVEWPGMSFKNVWHLHFSPDCTTMSTAERRTQFNGRNETHADDRSYRLPDGSPNPHAPQYRRDRVAKHDRTMNQVLMLMSVVARKHPHVLLTAENPKGAFELQPQVKKMIDSNEGWRLLRTHYCAAADPRYDGGELWSMKPSVFLTRGGTADLQLPQCNNNCRYRLPDSNRHLVSIRVDRNSDPRQQRVQGHMRHAIPAGVFQQLDNSHQHNHDAPAGVHAILDDSHARALSRNTQAEQAQNALTCTSCKCPVDHRVAAQTKASQARWKLIHARYGHQSGKRIGAKKLKGLTKVKCPTCLAAKITKQPHAGTLDRADYALGLVHTDLAEFRVKDIDGYKYAAIFVDDYTDRKWVYLLKNKSDYGEAFMLWLTEVGVPPTRVRSDWGGEYRAALENQFLKICLERGIWPEKSAPYTPQQNSKAERAVRSLSETARAMLLHANLDKEYWGYAMRYACYIDMHCISDRTNMSPYEAWHNHEAIFDPPVFGSQVYFAHAERNTDKKLDPRGHRALFLGFPTMSPGYYVKDLDSPEKSVQITSDVPISSFDEISGMRDASHAIPTDPELLVPNVTAEVLPEAIPMIGDDRTGIPQARIEYWHTMQRFIGERRQTMSKDMSAEDARTELLKEWKTRQLTIATDIKNRMDSQVQTEAIRKRLRSTDGVAIDVIPVTTSATPPSKASSNSTSGKHVADDLACEKCGSTKHEASMLICDGCDKGFHKKCIGMTRLPAKAHKWLCHTCIKPGMRISKFWQSDNAWHEGTVTMQYATEELGTDIQYDDGTREHTNLNHTRWQPLYENASATIGFTGVYNHHIPRDDDADEYFTVHNVMASWCPKTHSDILNSNPTLRDRWLASEDKEWNAVLRKDALKIVPLTDVPRGAVFVPTKWAYRVKADGTLKSRLCILGNKMPTTDYATSAPTPRLSSVRMLLKQCIESQNEFRILDCQAAFLNAPARGQTYLRLPPGRNKKGYAALLLRNLYGSTTAPVQWHNMLYNWFMTHGFETNPHDPCIYSRKDGNSYLHAICHVDDIGYTGSAAQCEKFKTEIEKDFGIDDLGRLGIDQQAMRYLGIQVKREKDRFVLHNSQLIDDLMERANKYELPKAEQVPIRDLRLTQQDCPVTEQDKAAMAKLPYRQLLGQVGYIALCTLPIISYAFKECSRFANNFGIKHWQALLSLCAYIGSVRDSHRLHITRGGGMRLSAYSDADWNGETDKHLSTTGWIIFMGDTPISWASRTQRCTAKSTAEAEYVAAASCAQELVYLQMLAASINHPTSTVELFSNEGTEDDPGCVRRWREWLATQTSNTSTIYTDSMNAIANASMPPGWLQEALRHIRTHFHFVKQFILDKSINLLHCRGENNCADIFTKGFGTSKSGNVNQRADVFKKHGKFCLGMREWSRDSPLPAA